MAPYRILQLITRADWGGAQRHVFDLATGLDPSRFAVTVACAPDGVLVDRLREAGVAVIPLPAFQQEISPFKDTQALKAVLGVIDQVGADLIHCHSSKAGFLGRLAARRAGAASVFTAHGFAFGGQAVSLPARAVYLAAEWWAGRFWSDRVIAVSEADRRMGLAWGVTTPDLLVTVHNGIDPTPYERIEDPLTLGRPPVVGVISRLVAGKGLEDLLRAAALLRGRGAYRFVLAGDGALKPALEEQARQLGLAEYTAFPGFVNPVEALGQIDLFVLPSYKEGLPYNVLEAMAAGRPVVATRVGGLPEVIVDGVNGALVPVGDVAALAEAIERLAAHPEPARLAAQARATIRTRFHREQMLARIADLYTELLAR